jgi:hypothetical protein
MKERVMSRRHRTLETVGTSPKAIASGLSGLVIGVLVAVLDAVQGNVELLGGLPEWVQVVLLAAIPAVIAYASAYVAPPGEVRERRSAAGPNGL